MKVKSDEWLEGTLDRFPRPKSEHKKGTLDLRVFLQDEVWVNIQGDVFQLEDMSHEYLLNVLKMLYNEAENYHLAILDWYATAIMIFMADFVSPTEEQRMSFLEDACSTVDMSAHAWLNSTPLLHKIEQLLG